jgi:DNA replication protein DnaC
MAKDCLRVPERFSDSDFKGYTICCPSEKIALDAVTEFAKNHKDHTGMIMIGGVGTGKTHLAYATCLQLANDGKMCKMTTVNKIVREVRAAWGGHTDETEESIINNMSGLDLLVIDEVGSQYGSDSERIIINEIINDRYDKMVPTIVIGNVTVSELQDILGARVYDRLMEQGKTLSFDWDSHRKTKQH